MKRQNVRKIIIILSFLLMPVTFYYLSPYLILQGAAEAIVTGSAIVFALQFLSGIFFGRIFCGWLCPAGGLQEIAALAKPRRAAVKWGRFVKYGAWAFWLAMIAIFFFRSGRAPQVDIFYQTVHGISLSEPRVHIMYYAVLLILLLPVFLAGRRGTCHYICWMAPFMVLGDKLGRLLRVPAPKLNADAAKCVSCGQCEKACQMSLPVSKLVQGGKLGHTDCIYCLECADTCPKKAISAGYGRR